MQSVVFFVFSRHLNIQTVEMEQYYNISGSIYEFSLCWTLQESGITKQSTKTFPKCCNFTTLLAVEYKRVYGFDV